MSNRAVLLAFAAAFTACRHAAPSAAPAQEEPKPLAVSIPPDPDPSILDRSVSPCEDFYQFACGGWLARTEIPPDKPAWSRGFADLRERNQRDLRGILEADAAGKGNPDDRYVDKVGSFYAACMDEAGVEARGLAELHAEWARIDAVKDAATLAGAVARLHLGGVFAVFSFDSDQDAKDATKMIGVISQGGLSLPDRDYYLKDDPKMAEIRALYAGHLEKMLRLAGVASDEAARETRAVMLLERDLAGSQWTRVEMRDPARIYNRVELAGVEKLSPRFPWKAYLTDLGYPDVTAISVTTPKNMEEISALVEKTSPQTWRAYLKWHLLSAMARARALPKAFVDEDFAFSSAAFTGAKELEPRWKRCVAATDRALGEALGQSYVRLYFGAGAKGRTSHLVGEIERAMGKDLEGVAWMDPPTRQHALAKLGKIFNKVGYPDAWRNYDALEVFRTSFFRSLLAANRFEVRRELNKIGKPVDRKEWQMTPPTVNAYYSPSLNEMVFPAGILQPPFFDRRAEEVVNYGSLGMIVGHELTHGFDDEGRQYDAEGNLRDWWTPVSAKEFERRTACMEKQYDGYVAVGDMHLNGKLTLGENIADLGGVKLAHAAYRAATAGKAPPAKLGGFTPDQAFFVGIAQAWCQNTRDPYARMLATVDPHSPPRFRVNGPLSNIPEFAAAFQCPAGSPMARPPAERCDVW